jgi:alpha/beta superfamily hydrolase
MENGSERRYLGETVEVAVAGGTIEATVAYGDATDISRVLLVFPPNPILGGDSQNNVVQALLEEAVARDALGVTFDYRGSKGERIGGVDMMSYWESLHAVGDFSGVLDDAAAVVERVGSAFGASGCPALAGYSFGSFMALQFAARVADTPVACISPPLGEYDFVPWLRKHQPGLFVASDDAFCTQAELARVVQDTGLGVQVVESDDHFFRGVEPTVARLVCDRLGL